MYQYTSILVLGLGIATFFWMPAIYDLQDTVFFQTKVSHWQDYFVGIDLIGFSTIAIFLVTLLFFFKKDTAKTDKRAALFFYIVGILAIVFATAISTPLWRILPVSFVQFPFRFLSITILSASFLTAALLSQLPKNRMLVAGMGIIILAVFSSKPFIAPHMYFDKSDAYYATNEATTTVQDEYMPKWIKQKPTKHFANKVEILKGTGEVKDLSYTSNKIRFASITPSESIVRVNTIYFPGWEAKIDNIDTEIIYKNDMGLMEITIPSGNHNVTFSFKETPIRLASDAISMLSGLVLFGMIIRKRMH